MDERRRAQDKALAATIEKARAVGRPDITTAPTNRTIHDERDLVIEFSGMRTWQDQVARSTCAADVVFVGTPTARTSYLTGDAQFILSEYRMRVDAVLRGTVQVPGGTVGYVRPGGAVLVENKTVTAKHNLYPDLNEGVSYIVFASRVPGTGDLTIVQQPQRTLDGLVGDSVVRAVGPGAAKELQQGLERDRVIAAIKSANCSR